MRYPRTWAAAHEAGRRHPYERRLPEPELMKHRFDWRLVTLPIAGFTTGWALMVILGGLL